jgi:hypothetical protein
LAPAGRQTKFPEGIASSFPFDLHCLVALMFLYSHYEVHAEEAALVKRIFTLYTEQGRSQEAIAALLTAEDMAPPGERHTGTAYRLDVHLWHQEEVARQQADTSVREATLDCECQSYARQVAQCGPRVAALAGRLP